MVVGLILCLILIAIGLSIGFAYVHYKKEEHKFALLNIFVAGLGTAFAISIILMELI